MYIQDSKEETRVMTFNPDEPQAVAWMEKQDRPSLIGCSGWGHRS